MRDDSLETRVIHRDEVEKASIQRKESQQSKKSKQKPGTKAQNNEGQGAACANRLIAKADTKCQKEHNETVNKHLT